MATITSPRPPLNLFEARRLNFSDNWVTLYDVPSYTIPAFGPEPERTVGTAAIMTGLMVANSNINAVGFSLRISTGEGVDIVSYDVATDIPAFSNDITIVPFDRQIMRDGERMEIRSAGQTLTAHFTFILNQREQFEVIV